MVSCQMSAWWKFRLELSTESSFFMNWICMISSSSYHVLGDMLSDYWFHLISAYVHCLVTEHLSLKMSSLLCVLGSRMGFTKFVEIVTMWLWTSLCLWKVVRICLSLKPIVLASGRSEDVCLSSCVRVATWSLIVLDHMHEANCNNFPMENTVKCKFCFERLLVCYSQGL